MSVLSSQVHKNINIPATVIDLLFNSIFISS